MSIRAQIRIKESDGAYPKVNIRKIMAGVMYEDYSYVEDGNSIVLTVKLPAENIFSELKRRLSAKKNRPKTVVKIEQFEGAK